MATKRNDASTAVRIRDGSRLWSGDKDLGVDEWAPAITALTTRFDIATTASSGFHGRLRAHVAGGIGLCDLSTGEHKAVHEPSSHGSDAQLHMLSVQLSGRAIMEVDGRTCVFEPGDMGFYGADQIGVVSSGDDYRSLCLTLPPSSFDIPRDYLRHVQAKVLGPDRGLTSTVSSLLVSLNDSLPRLTERQQARALRSAVDLVITLVLNEVGESQVEADPAVVLRDQMFAYIEDNLHDPELDVKQLAQRHFVSVRHVHNLFRGTGQTAAERIRSRRLEMARKELSDVRRLDTPVAAIAFQCGFTNPSHFGNLFKDRFGVTPAAFRQGARPDA
ncbi:helix-turn-helix domain-containing protein [Gordonia sp. NPDC127522]|uniref:helix-turn-helix domain-containing protein n=1 Tax=Gordonia sp. NPDC127522 TaxID=3345390 RepID=UPI003630CF3E